MRFEDIYDHSNYHIIIGWYYIDGHKLAFLWMARFLLTFIKRFDGDDSGSMEAKELSRLLFTLIDTGVKVISD